MSLLLTACSAASDVGSSASPSSLPLVGDPAAVVESSDTEATSTSTLVTASTQPGESTTTEASDDDATSSSTASTTTTAPSTTIPPTTTIAVDPNAEFCQAATAIDELGKLATLDDTEASGIFFTAQAERWDAAASAAPALIASDTQIVAGFYGEMLTLLAANDFDLFAVFDELTALEVDSGSDLARIRVDQFIFANCAVTPPLPEQATAAFYGQLLASAEDRIYLAELLASAEVFSLDGAQCFVGRATPDVMHPLVGAPSTAAQDAALASVLGACQISIGT